MFLLLLRRRRFNPFSKMKKLLLLPYFILLSSFCIGQTDLEYRLKKGDVFVIKQVAKQTITQDLEGTIHDITNSIDGILEFKVLDEKENHYLIELTFDDLNLRMFSNIQGEMMNVKAKELVPGDMQSQIFNAILHTPIQLTLEKTGNIIEVKGGNSLVSKMADASGLQDEFSLNLLKESLKKEFGSEALSNSYEQMTFIYPSNKVKIGDTWKNEYHGKLVAKNFWKLDSLNSKKAFVSGKAEVHMDIQEPETTMVLDGTQITILTADVASGFIQKMNVDGIFKGISTVTQMGSTEIPTTIKSTITYELINKYYVQ